MSEHSLFKKPRPGLRGLALHGQEILSSEFNEAKAAITRILRYENSISAPEIGSIFSQLEDSPVNRACRNIARAYGVQASDVSLAGTSAANTAAVLAMTKEDTSILAVRDHHVSVGAGLIHSGAAPYYIEPNFDPEIGISRPVTVHEVELALDRFKPGAFVITRPSYFGLAGDIQGIVQASHIRGIPVLTDQAWGPHYHHLRRIGFPIAAEDVHSDIVTQSTHKLCSAMNQGSVVHFNNSSLFDAYQEFKALGFQSTSFSYPIFMSVELAVLQLETDGERIWKRAVRAADRLRDAANQIEGVFVIGCNVIDGERVTEVDPARVILNVRDTALTGYELADALLKVNIVLEMATLDCVLLLVSPGVPGSQIDYTIKALRHIFQSAKRKRPKPAVEIAPPPLPQLVLTPREATRARRERVPVARAVGRTSAEMIAAFPPGSALIQPGEAISEECIRFLANVTAAGAHLKRVVQEHGFETILVVR